MADGMIVKVEVSDETAEMLVEEKRYAWKLHKREKRYESISTIEQREEKGEQITVDMAPSPEDTQIESEENAEIERLKNLLPLAISQLTIEQQILLQRVIYNGESQRSIAEEEGIKESAISMRMSRIYSRLKNILGKL